MAWGSVLGVLALAAPAGAVTFDTPGEHAYTVPADVTEVMIEAVGGAGGGADAENVGGGGAVVTSPLAVTPGQKLYAEVGSSAVGRTPGVNGGGGVGDATACPRVPGAGGGASDVRRVPRDAPGSLDSRVLVAPGGGGAGSPSASDDLAGQGGMRGEGGRKARDGAAGGDAGLAGQPGGSGALAGTVGAGGPGGVATNPAFGCGGGGGGGYDGGAGGQAATNDHAGGGGGGGGFLAPDGSLPGLPAALDRAPSITITPAGPDTATLHVTSTIAFAQAGEQNCPSSCTFCTIIVRTFPAAARCQELAAPAGSRYDAGWYSEQNWGSASRLRSYRLQSGGGVKGTAGTPAELGAPFPIGDFVHFNIGINGDSPTSLGLGGRVVVQPPAGEAVELPFGTRTTGGFPPHYQLNFLETDNAPPCDPAIQVSAVPCDDRWSIEPPYTTTATVGGVTWHLTLLGWDDLHGGYAEHFVTQELEVDERRLFATLTVDANATTTTQAADATAMTATVAPVPTTGGTVAFTADGQDVPGCDAVAVDTATGEATCPVAALSRGTHQVVARYSGGVGFASSASAALAVQGTAAPPDTPPPGGDPPPPPGGGAPVPGTPPGPPFGVPPIGPTPVPRPTTPGPLAPRILALSLTRTRVSQRSGVTLRIRPATAGRLRIVLDRLIPHRHGRTTRKRIRTIIHRFRAGTQRLTINRDAHARRLTRGTYRLTITTTNGKPIPSARPLTFHVRRG